MGRMTGSVAERTPRLSAPNGDRRRVRTSHAPSATRAARQNAAKTTYRATARSSSIDGLRSEDFDDVAFRESRTRAPTDHIDLAVQGHGGHAVTRRRQGRRAAP